MKFIQENMNDIGQLILVESYMTVSKATTGRVGMRWKSRTVADSNAGRISFRNATDQRVSLNDVADIVMMPRAKSERNREIAANILRGFQRHIG
jgi:hypothetical protein